MSRRKLKHGSWLYTAISQPELYLWKLTKNTFFVGVLALALLAIDMYTGNKIKVPAQIHSLLGVVIGLLLVFRTNTAYDRWWEGRKAMEGMLIACRKIGNEFTIEQCSAVWESLLGFKETIKSHGKPHLSTKKILACYNNTANDRELILLDNLLDSAGVCERIKNTPIPIAYALHIKISVFMYVMALPFGLFHDMGLMATPVAMIVYFVIAGIELISEEIEDPFHGDPNDLPVDIYMGLMKDALLNKNKNV